MPLALSLEDSLALRGSQIPFEFANGDTLGTVLTRDLLAVEEAADTDMLTSILLLEGNRLRHGAAPNLPSAYCAAIDGLEIGPSAGSCGTAAFLGRPVYVTDIGKDPLWIDYRHFALEHGLRACWSTPILADHGTVVGTFAIYYLTPRSPTPEEVEAIKAITDHVAGAILSSDRNDVALRNAGDAAATKPRLRIVSDLNTMPALRWDDHLSHIAGNFEAIVRVIDLTIDTLSGDDPHSPDIDGLRRAKKAAQRAASLARSAFPPGAPLS